MLTLHGTKVVLKTNPDTSAIEFNQVGTQILKAGEINWFVPNVTQAVIDAKITDPTYSTHFLLTVFLQTAA